MPPPDCTCVAGHARNFLRLTPWNEGNSAVARVTPHVKVGHKILEVGREEGLLVCLPLVIRLSANLDLCEQVHPFQVRKRKILPCVTRAGRHSACSLQQRWGAAVWWRKRRSSSLVGCRLELKCGLPGWEEAESRRAADTAAEGQLEVTRQWVWRRWGAWRRYQLGCWVRRRRGSRRQAAERLGERRRPRAWSGPARGRSVFWGGRAALLGL
jgi:hypothetical protein